MYAYCCLGAPAYNASISNPFGLLGAPIRKRKATVNSFLEHCEIIKNLERNGMRVKFVHCKGVPKANAEKLVYILYTSRAIRKMENVDLYANYLADVEAVLIE